MGIFDRVTRLVKSELNHQLRKTGIFDEDYSTADLEEELRQLEEELRRLEAEENRRNQKARGGAEAGHQEPFTGKRPSPDNAYAVLGVSPRVSQKELKDRYRNLAKKYHPDRIQLLSPSLQGTAKNKMKEINQAYNLVRDTDKRRDYDRKIGIY